MSAALVDEVLSAEKLAELFVVNQSPKHHETMLALLQKSDTAKLLASGQKTLLDFTSSPFAPPAVIEIEPAAVEVVLGVDGVSDSGFEPADLWGKEADTELTLSEAEEEVATAGDAEGAVMGTKTGRKRTATERLDNSAPEKKEGEENSEFGDSGHARTVHENWPLL